MPRHPDDHRGMGNAFAATSLFALAVTAFNFTCSLFFYRNHDWDIDAFLYLGSRLKHGELLYVHDFETKLPFVQYLFFIPSALGGIGVWKIMSFAIALICGAIASGILSKRLFVQRTETNSTPHATALLLSVFLMMLYSLPGSESGQISIVAASAAYLSMAFFLTRANSQAPARSIFISGIFWSLATLTRPNYLYPVILYVVFLAWKDESDNRRFGWLADSSLFFLGASLPGVAVFFPYMIRENGPQALFGGLRALGSFSEGYRLSALFINQFLTLRLLIFSFALVIVIILLFSRIIRKRESFEPKLIRPVLFSVLSILMLESSFLRTFFHPHYSIMLVPYAAVLLYCLSVASLPASRAAHRIRGDVMLLSILVALSAWRTTDNIIGLVWSRGDFSANINDPRIDNHLYEFLKESKQAGRSFLVVEAPIYHMLLDEPRIGDGHPAILRRVLSGEAVLGPISDIPLYSQENQRNPCNAIASSGKDLVITNPDSFFDEKIRKCEAWREHYREAHIPALQGYHVFLKKMAEIKNPAK